MKYGQVHERSYEEYFHRLINKTYKILPMKEEHSLTLPDYIKSYLAELLGNVELVSILENEPSFLTVVNTIGYLSANEYDVQTCRREVFKCINILKAISKQYFSEKESHDGTI